MFLRYIHLAWNYLNRHSLYIFVAGLMGIFFAQWHKWQKDKIRLVKEKSSPPNPPIESWPRLSKATVLVAAWNEAANIQAHIQSFLTLHYPRKQLVLVAGGRDGTYQLACEFASPHVIVIEQLPGEGKQRALRKGFSFADGEIIYFTDADCLLDDRSFEAVIYPIVTGQEQVTTGTSLPSSKNMLNPFIFSQASSQLYASYHLPYYFPGLLGRNCAIDRGTLLRSNALQFDTPSGTDYILAKSLACSGIPIRQLPSSQVATSYPDSFTGYFLQQTRWLANVATLSRQYGAPGEARSIYFNASLGFFMLVFPFLAVPLGPLVLVVWALLFLYAFFSRLRYASFNARLTNHALCKVNLIFLPCYLLLDFLVWAVSLPRLLRNRLGWK
jgi:cellulose synthase/poly-beta-1,6-N-acetylglucosamine synthase-like glycosyltransferase